MSIARWIDHTLLNVKASEEDIINLCKEAIKYGAYSVCINPFWVKTAFNELKDTNVKVCSVAGFPLGATFEVSTLVETEMAMAHGAVEIDMVMNVGAFKTGDKQKVISGIKSVTEMAHHLNPDSVVKVIVESAVLTDEEKRSVANLVADSGADFLKTSTGFVQNDNLLEDVQLFLRELPEGFKVKAAGGIRDYATAKKLLAAGVVRLGCSSTGNIVEAENYLNRKEKIESLK